MQLGSVTLHGYAEMLDPFVGLAVSAVNGWRGLPGARGSSDPIPGAHGSYQSARVLREERSIEIRGAAIALTESAALAMLDALEAAVAGVPVAMWVTDEQGSWVRFVEVETVQVIGNYASNRVRFAIDAIASDPRRYSAEEFVGPIELPKQVGGLTFPAAFPWTFGTKSGGTAELHNRGTADLFPKLEVSGGSFDSVTISVGGSRIEFGSLSEGQTLVVDSKQRRAFVDGVDVTRELLKREWPSLKPGETQTVSFACESATGDPTLVIWFQIGAW